MTNLSQLERDWKIYKRKEQRPYIVSILAFILVALLLWLFWPASTKTDKRDLNVSQKNLSQPSKQLESVTPRPKEVLITQKPKQQAQELRPSFNFMKQIKERPVKKEKKTPQSETKTAEHRVTPQKTRAEQKSHTVEKQHKVSVSSSSTQDRMSTLVKRFNNTKNPILGITIAKQYMKNRNYKQAYFYALEVNTIDRTNEESWLVTAQALYFMKKKASAIQVLQSYIKDHSSAKALKLLRKIKRDQLK